MKEDDQQAFSLVAFQAPKKNKELTENSHNGYLHNKHNKGTHLLTG
ncbi:hypothetical protein [Photobacterium satsumensis]